MASVKVEQTALGLLLTAVAAYYKEEEDLTTAGVSLARLENGNYYASVVRYPGGPFHKKVVVATGKNDTHETIADAIADIAVKWHKLASQPDVKSAVNALGVALRYPGKE